jgi:hypothetical protein
MSNKLASGSQATLVVFFKALADETRLKLVGLLANGPLTTEELAERLGVKAPTVSHHLEKLLAAGLVQPEAARGHRKPYALKLDALHDMAKSLLATETLTQVARTVDADTYAAKVLRTYQNPDGSLKELPLGRKKTGVILHHLVEFFEPGRRYSEKEVNVVLGRFHPDTASLRRDLIDWKLLVREKGQYWRPADDGR